MTPTFLAITVFLSPSPGLLKLRPGTWPLWVLVFSTAAYLWLVWSPTAQSGAWGPLCWVLAFSTTLVSNWSGFQTNWLPVFTELFNSSSPTFLWTAQSHSFNPSTVKVIFWYSLSGCTCYLHRCISYFDSPVGSSVNIQHIYIYIYTEWEIKRERERERKREKNEEERGTYVKNTTFFKI